MLMRERGHIEGMRRTPDKGGAAMHEIEMALELIKAVDQAVREHPGQIISAVRVKLGRARGIDPLALKAAFDWIKPDTVARGTMLQIEVIPTTVRCNLCDFTFDSDEVMPECPHCGGLGGEILTGNEFCVTSVEARLNPAVVA